MKLIRLLSLCLRRPEAASCHAEILKHTESISPVLCLRRALAKSCQSSWLVHCAFQITLSFVLVHLFLAGQWSLLAERVPSQFLVLVIE